MSFGGGDSPSNTQYATQFQREAPQIEADKLGLMGTARELTRFGMNPWELSNKDAKFGDADFGKYKYTGTTGPYVGKEWDDLTREQRTQEGQVNIPTQQLAGFEPQQQQAFNMASAGIGGFQPYLNQATQYAMDATQAYDPMSYQQYMNPYQNEVIAGIESQFDKAQSAAGLQAARTGAFGGGREGIQRAELGRQRAQTVGQAQAQNYGQAQQQAQQQAHQQAMQMEQMKMQQEAKEKEKDRQTDIEIALINAEAKKNPEGDSFNMQKMLRDFEVKQKELDIREQELQGKIQADATKNDIERDKNIIAREANEQRNAE